MRNKRKQSRYKKLLFVEYGSVDMDEVSKIEDRNKEIKVIVYRQGACEPKIVEI